VSEWVRAAIAGVPTGCVAALSGMGIVLTYRATGIFNFAHGAIAMFVAYVMWQLAEGWGVNVVLAAALSLLVFAPLLGLTLDAVVFRPLQRRGASTSERLVATLGVFVLLTGVALQIWTGQPKNAPRLFSARSAIDIFGFDDLATLAIVLIASGGLWYLFRRTYLGVQFRAVVDKRELSELAAVNANRISALAWVVGCTFAGLTGILLAPASRLDPYRLTLLVIDTFAVAVIARLVSLPVAVASGIGLGVVQSLLATRVPSAFFESGQFPAPFDTAPTNLLVTALIVFLVVYRRLDEVGSSESTGRGLVSSAIGSGRRTSPRTRLVRLCFVLVVLAAPLILTGDALLNAQQALGYYVLFLSIVVITGFSGHITLGAAGFAGLGAYLTARFAEGQVGPLGSMPVLVAMLLSSAVLVLVGLATGYPALRRKGLFLGLTTLAVGLVISRFVFDNPWFSRGGVTVERPELFGLSLRGERAFFWYAVGCAAFATFLARNLRSGRLGRVLAAMRDSEVGATSVGISLRRYKLVVFAASAFLAGLGGTLLAQQSRTFEPDSFTPFASLFFFTAVVVAGLSYLSGAGLAAVLFVVVGSLAQRAGTAEAFFGLLALFIGRLPGGLVGTGIRVWRTGPAVLRERFARERERAAVPPVPVSDFGRRVLQDVGR
jgi:branched-chain amino acid transport system permease protein